MRHIHPQLSAIVQEVLPAARIETLLLPGAGGISLYLINADYPDGPVDPDVALRLMERPFYWSFCWASGLVLCRFIVQQPHWVQGKRVLDFGCGSGVVAIAAARAGAREVIACDIDPLALLAAGHNARLNGVELQLTDSFEHVTGDIDAIIVADVLYDRENLPWLNRFTERAPSVLVADSRVRNFNYPPYRQIARLSAHTLPDLDESAEFRDVRIYSA